MVYARYEEGYRPGGLSIDSDFIQRFEGDRIGTAEIGLRWGGATDGNVEIGAWLAVTLWNDIPADLLGAVAFTTAANCRVRARSRKRGGEGTRVCGSEGLGGGRSA